MHTPSAKILLSPAKLNLGLRIVGRRTDGLHELQSLFWPVDLVDEIAVSPSNTPQVEMQWHCEALSKKPLPLEKDNLVFQWLRQEPKPLEVRIDKRIPMGAGLGGSSSNLGTIMAWSHSGQEAQGYGADVPFFLNPKPSWVEGIGEKITPLIFNKSLGQLYFLLVIPPSSLATPQVFSTFKEMNLPFTPKSGQLGPSLELDDLCQFLQSSANDLQTPAIRLYPLLGDILSELGKTACITSQLTGSGSVCFAVYENERLATQAVKALSSFFRLSNCKATLVKTFLRRS